MKREPTQLGMQENRDRHAGDRWYCSGCQQHVKGRGTWCALYEGEDKYCVMADIHWFATAIDAADAVGDGPMVNALCWQARSRFGIGLRW